MGRIVDYKQCWEKLSDFVENSLPLSDTQNLLRDYMTVVEKHFTPESKEALSILDLPLQYDRINESNYMIGIKGDFIGKWYKVSALDDLDLRRLFAEVQYEILYREGE